MSHPYMPGFGIYSNPSQHDLQACLRRVAFLQSELRMFKHNNIVIQNEKDALMKTHLNLLKNYYASQNENYELQDIIEDLKRQAAMWKVPNTLLGVLQSKRKKKRSRRSKQIRDKKKRTGPH